MRDNLNIIFEDEYIIVCDKPAGVPTQAGKITDKDMVSVVNNHIKKADPKAMAYLIHRLDKPVRGLLVFAKTKQAASELSSQITNGIFDKRYYALIEAMPNEKEGKLTDYIYKKDNRAYVCEDKDKNKYDAKLAKLEYKIIDISDQMKYFNFFNSYDMTATNIYLADIHLLTGRFHQIRCQFGNIGCPIMGDALYGAKEAQRNIALVSYSLSFVHPKTKEPKTFVLGSV